MQISRATPHCKVRVQVEHQLSLPVWGGLNCQLDYFSIIPLSQTATALEEIVQLQ